MRENHEREEIKANTVGGEEIEREGRKQEDRGGEEEREKEET